MEVNELKGKKILITAGPTCEKIDPVRFISNYSSGKQGYLIAETLASYGAEVILVTGPVSIPPPNNVTVIKIESADDMLAACLKSLPVDVTICTAAVVDFKPKFPLSFKLKKDPKVVDIPLILTKNPDILASIAKSEMRPKLVIGFALETQDLIENSKIKLETKECDFILANELSADNMAFNTDDNAITIISKNSVVAWPKMSKKMIAEKLAEMLVQELQN
jgi:phosphopantothenoylcysteine synthetase/decarboxylase